VRFIENEQIARPDAREQPIEFDRATAHREHALTDDRRRFVTRAGRKVIVDVPLERREAQGIDDACVILAIGIRRARDERSALDDAECGEVARGEKQCALASEKGRKFAFQVRMLVVSAG